jgi:mono/diheme cytochrome c family protein
MNVRILRSTGGLLLAGALALLLSATVKADDAAAAYKSNCAACHGADGSGNPALKAMHIPDLRSADVQKKSDADLTAMITNGKGSMPAYKSQLSDDQIHQLVTFIRGLAKNSK